MDKEYYIPYVDLAEDGIQICSFDSDELMVDLDVHSLDTLKTLQRYLSWAMNKKMYGHVHSMQKRQSNFDALCGVTPEMLGVGANDTITLADFNRAKEALEKNNVPKPYSYWVGGTEYHEDDLYNKLMNYTIETEETYSKKWTINMNYSTTALPINFDNLPCQPCEAPYIAKSCKTGRISNTAKEEVMNISYSAEQEARRHLVRRTDDVYYAKDASLYDTFNVNNVRPKNAKQAKDWLARGGFVITSEDDESYHFNSAWQNPDKPRNEEGFKAAQKLLGKAYADVKDAIIVKSPEDGLKALQEFEAQVYN